MSTENRMDEFFRRKAAERKLPFELEDWHAMEALLDESEGRKRPVFWWIFPVLGLLLIGGITYGSWQFFSVSNSTMHSTQKDVHVEASVQGASKSNSEGTTTSAMEARIHTTANFVTKTKEAQAVVPAPSKSKYGDVPALPSDTPKKVFPIEGPAVPKTSVKSEDTVAQAAATQEPMAMANPRKEGLETIEWAHFSPNALEANIPLEMKIDSLSVDEPLTVKRQRRPVRLKLLAGLGAYQGWKSDASGERHLGTGTMAGAEVHVPVLRTAKSWGIDAYAGVMWHRWGKLFYKEEYEQEIYTFGVNTLKQIATVKNVHYIDLPVGVAIHHKRHQFEVGLSTNVLLQQTQQQENIVKNAFGETNAQNTKVTRTVSSTVASFAAVSSQNEALSKADMSIDVPEEIRFKRIDHTLLWRYSYQLFSRLEVGSTFYWGIMDVSENDNHNARKWAGQVFLRYQL